MDTNESANFESGFQVKQLSGDIEQFTVRIPKNEVNAQKLDACLEFLQETNLPEALLSVNQICFQAMADPIFQLSRQQIHSIEAITVLLTKCWIAESGKGGKKE